MVRSYQPDVIMANRLEVSGDFVSPEQIILPKGFKDESGRNILEFQQFLRSLLNNDKDQRAWLPGLFFTFV